MCESYVSMHVAIRRPARVHHALAAAQCHPSSTSNAESVRLAWALCSPVLFLLVMDPILLELQSKSNGLNISGLFLGALSHADDIRIAKYALSTNLTDCRDQRFSSVSSFAIQRGLMLSTEKCEAIISPSTPANTVK